MNTKTFDQNSAAIGALAVGLFPKHGTQTSEPLKLSRTVYPFLGGGKRKSAEATAIHTKEEPQLAA